MNLSDNISFQSSLERAQLALINMKKSLETYKMSNSAVPKFVESREQTLATLTNYVVESNDIIEQLKDNVSEIEKEAVRKGLQRNETAINNLLTYGTVNPRNTNEKESIRTYSKLKAMEKWPELY
jgi:hypothetical protein